MTVFENNSPHFFKSFTGVAGQFIISENHNSPLKVSKNIDSYNWTSAEISMEIKGEHSYFELKSGWHVFIYGRGEDSHQQLVGLMDQAKFLDSDRIGISKLSAELTRALSWNLLPEAIVIAIHPNSGNAFFIRDSAGFIPLYAKNDGVIYFSTNLSSVRDRAENKAINTNVINKMLVFSHGSTSRTIWQQVRVVAPGQLVQFCPGMMETRDWIWNPTACYDGNERRRLSNLSLKEALNETRIAFEESLAPLEGLSEIEVPCGGGVDSSLLGAYLAKRGQKIKFWCINQPEAERSEQEWMQPLSEQLNIPCEYANIYKEGFLSTLLEQLYLTGQPLVGPNVVGGVIARKLALEQGARFFVSGEMCDTVFGGLGPFGRLNYSVRIFRLFSLLPYKIRMQIYRGLIGEHAWLLDSTQVEPIEEQAMIGHGNLEFAEKITESLNLPTGANTRQSKMQSAADSLTWIQIRDVASGLNPLFFEKDELVGGETFYPFAHSRILNLGLHLPYSFKVHKGYKKWLWRTFASEYLGTEVAFRKKYSFPTLTTNWLSNGENLLKGGFLQDLLGCDIHKIYKTLPVSHTARWAILNIELWGRIHICHETTDQLMEQLM